MQEALRAHVARSFDEAERLYRRALAATPDQPDVLHMLGVVRYEKHDYSEARRLIERALHLTDWRYPQFRHNLGLVLSRANDPLADRLALKTRKSHASLENEGVRVEASPRVAVVVPAYNHARFIEKALESVFAQTYRDIEIVVLDDGSTDSTMAIASGVLERSPFPYQISSRPNRGAASTINEAIGLCTAPYVNVLNSDDQFDPERIRRMVDQVAANGRRWGMSGVRFIDVEDRDCDLLADARTYTLACQISNIPFRASVGIALVCSNVTVSSGNLFFAHDLWQALGGFADLRYNHDWDFALRALWLAEPVFVPEPLYRYRIHGGNTILESSQRARVEAHEVMRGYLRAATSDEMPPNADAPSVRSWGLDFVLAVLREGLADVLDAPALKSLVDRIDDGADVGPTP